VRRKAQKAFPARLKALLGLEAFISSVPWLSQDEKNRALIIAGETFDNIVCHSDLRSYHRIRVRVSKGRDVRLLILFKDPGFKRFARNVPEIKPYFDSTQHRYRGLGVLMCKELSRSIRYRAGSRYDSILVIL
jgi:anti-sigma regulatory factor (Ser/Thr protein kinase)